MSRSLHLTISTPDATVVDVAAQSVRAEDDSGSFGVLPGHADLLTVLSPSVVRWRDEANTPHFCAVRGGILVVSGGNRVAIACRKALLGDRLEELEADIHTAREAEADAEKRARVAQAQLHARAVRQLMRYLAPGEADRLGEILNGQRP